MGPWPPVLTVLLEEGPLVRPDPAARAEKEKTSGSWILQERPLAGGPCRPAEEKRNPVPERWFLVSAA
jgi:hypothetical protein